jgi:hypothetical protein
VEPAIPLAGNQATPAGRQLAASALLSAADLLGRLAANSSGHGVGLRGGTFRTRTAGNAIHAELAGVRWAEDVSVTGTLTWRARPNTGRASLNVRAEDGTAGTVRIRWPASATDDRALLEGRIGGRLLRATAPAP